MIETVRDLIEALQKLPPDTKVDGWDAYSDQRGQIVLYEDSDGKGALLIEGKSDD